MSSGKSREIDSVHNSPIEYSKSMSTYPKSYDVIVIGAGHAGCEAALAAARMGYQTLVFSINIDMVAHMPCSPSIGGLGKGHLVKEIVECCTNGYALRKLVGFYRIHAQSRVIEEELRRNNIPYKIIGGLKFYARKEVKDILAYLKVLHNPEDEISLKRIINSPKRGIGTKTLEQITFIREERGVSIFDAMNFSTVSYEDYFLYHALMFVSSKKHKI